MFQESDIAADHVSENTYPKITVLHAGHQNTRTNLFGIFTLT